METKGYENYRNMIKSTLEEVFEVESEKVRDNMTDYEMEEVEYKSRDGFWSWIDGGFKVIRWLDLGYLVSTGYRFGVKEIDEKMEELITHNYGYAKEQFIDNHPEYKGRENEVNYQDLSIAGNEKLAEELDYIEGEGLYDMSLLCDFTVQYYDAGNYHSDMKDKDAVYISAVVNYEAPYHRSGANNEVLFIAETIAAADSQDRIKELATKAKETFDNIRD